MKLLVLLLVLLVGLSVTGPAAAANKRRMELADMFKFKRVADPQISPDGKHVAYVVTTLDLDNNATSASIWLAPRKPTCA